jgi:trk system potassium uptake protein TrkH
LLHIDITPVARVVGLMLCGLAAVMLVPAAVDAVYGSSDWIAFAESAAVTAFIGGAMVLATQGGHASKSPLSISRRPVADVPEAVRPPFVRVLALGLPSDLIHALRNRCRS